MDVLLWIEMMDKNFLISSFLIMVFLLYTTFQDKFIRILGPVLIFWYTIGLIFGFRKSPRPSFSEGRRRKARIEAGDDPSLVDVQNRSDYFQTGNHIVRARLDGSDNVRIRARLVEAKTDDKEQKIAPLYNTKEELKTTMEAKENEGQSIPRADDAEKVNSGKQLKDKKGKKSKRGRRKNRARANLLGESHLAQMQQNTSEEEQVSQSEERSEDEESKEITQPNFTETGTKEQLLEPPEKSVKDGETYTVMQSDDVNKITEQHDVQENVQQMEEDHIDERDCVNDKQTESLFIDDALKQDEINEPKQKIQPDDAKLLPKEDNPENEVKKSSKKKKKKGRRKNKARANAVPENQMQAQLNTPEADIDVLPGNSDKTDATDEPNVTEDEQQEKDTYEDNKQAEILLKDDELTDRNKISEQHDVRENVHQNEDIDTIEKDCDTNEETKSVSADAPEKDVKSEKGIDNEKQEKVSLNNRGNEMSSKKRSSKKKKKSGRRKNKARAGVIVDNSEQQTQVEQGISEENVDVRIDCKEETAVQLNATEVNQAATAQCVDIKPAKTIVDDKVLPNVSKPFDGNKLAETFSIDGDKNAGMPSAVNDNITEQLQLIIPEKQKVKDNDSNKINLDIQEQNTSISEDVAPEKSDETERKSEIVLNDGKDDQKPNKNDPETDEKEEKISSEKNEKVLPEVSEAPKKSTRKQRKRKNPNKSKFKANMDDSSETSSNSDMSTKNDVQPEKTVIYSPLTLYLQLNMDMYTLYHELRNHLLTKEQMKMYGFPEEAPDRPGRAIMRTQNVTKGSTERRCCRCGSVFNILPDGRYVSDTLCRYHARKQLPYRRGHPYRGDYPCCNGNYMSEGCVTWQYHVTAESALHDVEFVKTKTKKHLNEVTAGTVYALDCEMLYTTAGMEVAKVGIVGLDGLTVFESFVLPQNQVLDYNTAYSGVTEKDLKGVTMTLVDVQTYLLKLLNQESILVGHGLENDLKALRLIHGKIVDTSVVFPFQHTKVHKKSLKNLALEFLNKDIQQSANGHNCIEDARTCMELMLHKISSDIKDRPPVTQDENKNSILQNKSVPEFHPAKYPVYQPWPYSCQYSYCSDSYRNSFYSGSLMPKNYNNCIYG